MPDTVFISWSKSPSDKLALVLKWWIKNIVPSVDVFFSKDIGKGREWHSEVKKGLTEACYGIICVTNRNLEEKWMLFEAGALYSKFELTRVAPVLFDVQPGAVGLPLASLQCVSFQQDEMSRLAKAVNASITAPLGDDFIEGQAERLWPELEEKVGRVLAEAVVAHEPQQPQADVPALSLKDVHDALLRQTEMVQEIYRRVTQGFGHGGNVAESGSHAPPRQKEPTPPDWFTQELLRGYGFRPEETAQERVDSRAADVHRAEPRRMDGRTTSGEASSAGREGSE